MGNAFVTDSGKVCVTNRYYRDGSGDRYVTAAMYFSTTGYDQGTRNRNTGKLKIKVRRRCSGPVNRVACSYIKCTGCTITINISAGAAAARAYSLPASACVVIKAWSIIGLEDHKAGSRAADGIALSLGHPGHEQTLCRTAYIQLSAGTGTAGSYTEIILCRHCMAAKYECTDGKRLTPYGVKLFHVIRKFRGVNRSVFIYS
ncbi:hypothetical protein D3C86_1388920 [compost metagenome]